jgi:hypothetical protein
MKARLLAAASAALLLAGCGGHKEKEDQRTASGQVLQGTISDDMLPLATVTSQPPRMPVKRSASNAADDQDDVDEAALDQAADDTPPASTDSPDGD